MVDRSFILGMLISLLPQSLWAESESAPKTRYFASRQLSVNQGDDVKDDEEMLEEVEKNLDPKLTAEKKAPPVEELNNEEDSPAKPASASPRKWWMDKRAAIESDTNWTLKPLDAKKDSEKNEVDDSNKAFKPSPFQKASKEEADRAIQNLYRDQMPTPVAETPLPSNPSAAAPELKDQSIQNPSSTPSANQADESGFEDNAYSD